MKSKNCRCCGEATLEEYDQYEICSTCGWEDDSYQYKYPDFWGGANDLSLNDHRTKWIESQKEKHSV